MRPAISNQPAENLSQLLALYDKAFVHCAYLTILGRSPDAGGLETYYRRIRLGERKVAILAQLYQSSEGQAFATELPGLAKALAAYRISCWPIIGRLYLMARKADGDSAQERKLRSIENAVYKNSYELLDKIERLNVMVTSRTAAAAGPATVAPPTANPAHKIAHPAVEKPATGGFVPA